MRLSELLNAINVNHVSGTGKIPDPEIVSIHYRADQVRPGGLFVAIPGLKADGHDYIDQALDRGAAAVIIEKPVQKKAILVKVDSSRKALSGVSAKFFLHPSEKLTVIGITGTNGKTTTSYLIESILLHSKIRCGVIGTINYRFSDRVFNNPMTTPESADLHEILSEMSDEDVTHVVMEASSHAIDLERIRNIRIRIGVFTNLSQDHLDYHGDMASYWACKKRLFTESLDMSRITEPAFAVINCLNKEGEELREILESREVKPEIITIGTPGRHQVSAADVTFDLDGITGLINTPSGNFEFRSSLVGRFNLDNILCATGAGLAIGLPVSAIAKGIEKFTRVPGRLEPVGNHSGCFVFVDYAHTPDALENVLSTLRALTSGRLICVFGCGGDRDRSKRPMMGEIAGRYSDLSIITSDNPRTENPMAIIEEIASGIKKVALPVDLKTGEHNRGYFVEPDRKKAIEAGISESVSGDTVLIAGKGHETYQIVGVEKFPFDDRVAAENALKNKGI